MRQGPGGTGRGRGTGALGHARPAPPASGSPGWGPDRDPCCSKRGASHPRGASEEPRCGGEPPPPPRTLPPPAPWASALVMPTRGRKTPPVPPGVHERGGGRPEVSPRWSPRRSVLAVRSPSSDRAAGAMLGCGAGHEEGALRTPPCGRCSLQRAHPGERAWGRGWGGPGAPGLLRRPPPAQPCVWSTQPIPGDRGAGIRAAPHGHLGLPCLDLP